MPELNLRFFRGMGDRCHLAQILQLYRRRGYDPITVHSTNDGTAWIWPACGIRFVPRSNEFPLIEWNYPTPWVSEVEQLVNADRVARGVEDYSSPPMLEGDAALPFVHSDQLPEWLGHVAAWNIGIPPLPPLEISGRDLWDEFTGARVDVRRAVGFEATERAAQFLKGLRRPIVALHPVGVCLPGNRPLLPALILETLGLLVDADVSVVVMDWGGKVPCVGDPNCRSVLNRWGKINMEEQAALYSMIDLFVGVDSGPFHLAGMCGAKRLGLCREKHILMPWRSCLPYPGDLYLVPEACREAAEFRVQRREQYPTRFYQGAMTAADIMGAVSKQLGVS